MSRTMYVLYLRTTFQLIYLSTDSLLFVYLSSFLLFMSFILSKVYKMLPLLKGEEVEFYDQINPPCTLFIVSCYASFILNPSLSGSNFSIELKVIKHRNSFNELNTFRIKRGGYFVPSVIDGMFLQFGHENRGPCLMCFGREFS